jgi:outer membrane protein OmpU
MKKILLGTSALVVAAVAAASAPAVAQTAPAAGITTSSGMSVTIGGYARQYVTLIEHENAAPALRTGAVDQTSDNRLILTFRQALPSGMSAGAVWQINPNAGSTGTSITRRMWSFVEGSFGLVQLGGADNVGAQSGVGSFEAFTGGYVIGDNNALGINSNTYGVTTSNFNHGGTNPSTGLDTDRIANKIVYFTPRIEGFQLGINYTPENSFRQGIPVANTQYVNGWAGNVNYVNTIAGVAVRASVGYLQWDNPSNVGLDNTVRNNFSATPKMYNAGLGLQYMGIDVGGSYSRTKDFRSNTTGTTWSAAALGTRTVDGSVWEMGIGYIFGPAAVSINYTEGKNEDAAIANGVKTLQGLGDDKIKVLGASARYTLAPGVNVNLGVHTAKYSEGTINTGANSNLFGTKQEGKSTGVVTGLTLAF